MTGVSWEAILVDAMIRGRITLAELFDGLERHARRERR